MGNKIECVALDAMGVIYKARDDVAELLVPFARSNGCRLSDRQISNLYLRCSLGQVTSAELWHLLGLQGDCEALNDRYLRSHELMPGIRNFLRRMHTKRVPVACLSNDVAEWSLQLRRMHRLESAVGYWIINGQVGARKPDAQIYEHFIKTTAWEPQSCLMIDDQVSNLDTALNLGFQTALYTKDQLGTSAAEHLAFSSYEEIESVIST